MHSPNFYGTVQQAPDKWGVIAHTPDPTQYHRQSGATMIPRHRQFGGSRGFDTRAGVVRVVNLDNDQDPGIEVDVELLNQQDVLGTLDNSADAHEALLKLGMEQGRRPLFNPFAPPQQNQPRVNPIRSGYVVPEGTLDGRQLRPQTAAPNYYQQPPQQGSVMPIPRVQSFSPPNVTQQPPAPVQQQAAQTQPMEPIARPAQLQMQPVQAPVQPPVPQPAAPVPQMNDQVLGVLMQMQHQMMAMQQQINQQASPPPPVYAPTPQPEQYVPPDATALGGAVKMSKVARQAAAQKPPATRNGKPVPTYTPPDWVEDMRTELEEDAIEAREDTVPGEGARKAAAPRAAQAGYSKAVDGALAELGLPFITTTPGKPKYQLYFDLGEYGGQVSAWYHNVEVSGRCLAIMWDSRYEGMQYVPAPTGADRTVKVVIPKLRKAFDCCVGEFKIPLGVVDTCLLVIVKEHNDKEDEETGGRANKVF